MIVSAMVLSLTLMGQQSASTQADAARLESCFATIRSDPAAGLEGAMRWQALANEPNARHCVAVALVANGQPEEGAARLEALANAPDGGGLERRAMYLAVAGNAWMLAKAPQAAEVALTNALKLTPQDPDLFVDRALARLEQKKDADAEADLDTALKLSPGSAVALQFRAQALKSQGKYDAALRDAEAALRSNPQNMSLLTLRGDIVEAKRVAEGR